MAFSTTTAIVEWNSRARIRNFLYTCLDHVVAVSRKPVSTGYLLQVYGDMADLGDVRMLGSASNWMCFVLSRKVGRADLSDWINNLKQLETL